MHASIQGKREQIRSLSVAPKQIDGIHFHELLSVSLYHFPYCNKVFSLELQL